MIRRIWRFVSFVRSILTNLVLVAAVVSLPSSVWAKSVNLKWKPIEGAKQYHLEVATDESFAKPLVTQTLQKTSLATDLKSGIYFLRVQGVDALGQAGHWSKPFKLAVTAKILPLASSEPAHEVSYIAKTPDIVSTWKPQEPSTQYRVRIEKDGKEILKKDTSVAKIDFKPTEPGEYKVEVSSGMDHKYSAPVTVDVIKVEKKELIPPAWNMSEQRHLTTKKAVNLKWSPVPGADSYRLAIYKEVTPEGSTDVVRTPVSTQDLTTADFVVPPLPAGHYVARVESVSGQATAAPAKDYSFEVKRAKPVEFERVDVAFRYNMTLLNYRANLLEGGGLGTSFYSTAGSMQVDGTMWLPDSPWGLRALGGWGGFTVQQNTVTYNDLQAAATRRYSFMAGGYKSEIKPYLGARAWNVPLIVTGTSSTSSQNGSNNNNSNGMQIFDLTLAGPVFGADFLRPLSDRWALTALVQGAIPLTNSTAAGGSLSGFSAKPTMNPKIEAGIKYALPGTLRLIATVGYQQENLKWPTLTVNSNNSSTPYIPPSGSTSNVSMNETNFTIGIEASDDGPLFRSSTDTLARPDRFSDFAFNLRYIYLPMSYSSSLIYSQQSSGSLPIQYAGAAELDASGWFKDSHNGVRLTAGWNGFTFNNTNISNPEFYAQWGYRPRIAKSSSAWSFKNYLGARSWRMTVISFDSNNGTVDKTGGFNAISPQLVGATENIQLTKDLGSAWSAKVSLEASMPFLFADKDSSFSNLYPTLNYKTEVAAVKTFSEDLSAGLGVGYKLDKFQFDVPGFSGSSSVTITSPTISLFGTYFF